MSFLETPRFPDHVAYGFIGGAAYRTTITVVASGREQRNVDWSAARGRWVASHKAKTQADTDALIDFFHAVNGSAHGFRFKDFTDYRCSGAQGIVVLVSGTTYQLKKRYTAGALTTDRVITKPVSPITIAGGGTYTVNYATGTFTHDAGAAPTGWSGEFDVPCRFDSDEMRIEVLDVAPPTSSSGLARYTWGGIEILEIRV